MSATINADLFASYFALPLGGRLEKAPIVEIDKNKHTYHVEEYYIEDLGPLGPVLYSLIIKLHTLRKLVFH